MKKLEKQSGVCVIKNLVNNKVYIGKSENLRNRLSMHLSQLKRQMHKNQYLQRSFNKHGEGNFSFEILEICEPEIAYQREIFWIAKYKSHIASSGYNKTTGGDGMSGIPEVREKLRRANLGKIHSETTKRLMSEAQKKRYKENPAKKKVQFYQLRKPVLQLDLQGILIKEWESAREAARCLNIAHNLIGGCCREDKYNKTAGGFKWKYKAIEIVKNKKK